MLIIKNISILALCFFALQIQAYAKENVMKRLFSSMETFQQQAIDPTQDQQKVSQAFQDYAICLLKSFPQLCNELHTNSWQHGFMLMKFYVEVQQVLMLLAQSNIDPERLGLTEQELANLDTAMVKVEELMKTTEQDFKQQYA